MSKQVNYSDIIASLANDKLRVVPVIPADCKLPEEISSLPSMMLELVCYLTVIRCMAKDIHYTYCKGSTFYGIHLLMDRVAKGINTQIDDIKEKYFMVSSIVPPSQVIEARVVELLPEATAELTSLRNYITSTLQLLDSTESCEKSLGVDNLLGGIAEDLLTKLALVDKSINSQDD